MSRLTIEFPDKYADKLDSLAKAAQTTKSDILRRAITSYQVLQEATLKGQEVMLVDNEARTTTRLILP